MTIGLQAMEMSSFVFAVIEDLGADLDSSTRYMRYVKFDFFFNRVIVRTHHLHLLYRFKIFEYIFVLAFLISIYVSFFINNASFVLREKVRARLRDIESEKEKLLKMEKDPANKLMAA